MSFRVMTYNILKGGIGREKHLQEVIHRVNPQVVVLQEVVDPDVLQSLGISLGMQAFFGKGNRKTQVALLSRVPIVNFISLHPPFPVWHNIIEADVHYRPNQSFHLMGVHLIANLWLGFELWRYLEILYLLKRYQIISGQPTLLAGDFNSVAPGDKVLIESMPAGLRAILLLQGKRVFRLALQRLLAAGFLDCFRFLYPQENGFTLPPPEPNTRLDYIFVSPQMQKHLIDCRVVQEPETVIQASDHYPVIAEFDLGS